MDNFSYQSPTRYVFGKGVENQTGKLVNEIGCKKIMLVYGRGSAVKSGLIDRVKASLADAGIKFTELSGICPNPTDDKVREGIDICRAENVDGLLAVGGGSVIDTAKAIAAGTLYNGDFWDFYCGKAIVKDALPIGVVLTIPAAGSEGSGNSVITNSALKQKISIRTDYALRPKFAVMNPELTLTLPMSQTAAGIADMMAHIMERYFSPTEGVETTDRLCEGLLKAIITEGRTLVENPDNYDARANIMWSGTLAHNGICGCGRREEWSAHGLEHVLSALYDVTHGAGLAVAFPAWMTYMTHKNPSKIAQFGRRVFDVDIENDREAAMEGIKRLREFFKYLSLPLTLGDLGITDPDFGKFTSDFHRDKGTPWGNYYPLYPSDTEIIYRLMQ
ncbi:MAG: iron-containing alcohol dehydrogenase [Muribaculaceae bacterium]